MTGPVLDPFLCAEDATLAESIRLSNQRDDKVTRDTCSCGGYGCSACGIEPFVRRSLKSQQARLR